MLGSFGHPTSNNAQQCPTMLAFVGINVGIVWPGLYKDMLDDLTSSIRLGGGLLGIIVD